MEREQVGTANGRAVNLDDRIGLVDDPGVRDLLHTHVADAHEHDRLHAGCSISTR